MRTAIRATRLFVLLAVAVYFSGVVPSNRTVLPRVSRANLQYGQALAFSDLDGDHKIDQATLSGCGADKTIKLFLSRGVDPSILRFSTESVLNGSLLARDIDNDGDVDLVWTDTVNPNNVVVWVNDGVGRFQQASYGSSYGFSGQFVIGTDEVSCSTGAGHDLSGALGKTLDFDAPEAQCNLHQGNSLAKILYSIHRKIARPLLVLSERAPPIQS